MTKLSLSSLSAGIAILGTAVVLAATPGSSSPTTLHNTPRFVTTAKNMGAVPPSTVIEVSIWLNPHNQADLDRLAKDLYDPQSPNYRHWLSKSEFASKYAPTAEEAKAVQDFFTANNLKIVRVGPDNFYVRARGTVADVNKAFDVSLNNYQVNGKIVRANDRDPYLPGGVASLVASVAGLDSMEYTHPLLSRNNIVPPSASAAVKTEAASPAASPDGLVFDPRCFNLGDGTIANLTTMGGLPTATFSGNGYSNNPAGCGYTPQNIYTAYNLTPLYDKGLNGKGQTIVIIDWCGSPTILGDANAFSKQFGLPKLTPANFTIINTAPSYCSSPDAEINLDVEWSHAIAPGAAIDLVVPPTPSFQDVNEALYYAVDNRLGNVISNSYGSEELFTDDSVLLTENVIIQLGAVFGISSNFSSGDEGDFTFDLPALFPASVSAPASATYATGVGGITLGTHADGAIHWQAGWGNNLNLLSDEGTVFDPPEGFFYAGSGGGPSGYFAKPTFQSALPGAARQVPDISWLADPFTGVYIAITESFTQPALQYTVAGGTSVACPMFSGLWAIANQAAGTALGQAAASLYTLPAGTITDILPVNSKTNVAGSIVDSMGTTAYTAADLSAPLENTTLFLSALWNYPLIEDTVYVLSFGTDSGLVVTKGYDNVTGLGVPNGAAFVEAFKP